MAYMLTTRPPLYPLFRLLRQTLRRSGATRRTCPSSRTSLPARKSFWTGSSTFCHRWETGSISVTRKNPLNVYKSCPKIISLEKWKILTPLQKLPKYVGNLAKLIVANSFEKLPKVQKIAQSGHSGCQPQYCTLWCGMLGKCIDLPWVQLHGCMQWMA